MSSPYQILANFPAVRPRRLRVRAFSRSLIRENVLTISDLIQPIFIIDGIKKREPIHSMLGIERVSIDELLYDAENITKLGIPAIAIFPVTLQDHKSNDAREAYNPNGLTQRAVKTIRDHFPELGIITDIALDPFTLHGHDGLVDAQGNVLNDVTIEILVRQSLSHAAAGADIVAPSDMMDGRVQAIRTALETHGFIDTKILSYAVKYASSFYGPFRDAIGLTGKTRVNDKRSYQMDVANSDEAIREVALDIAEGADLIMIKPGLPYLDVVRRIKEQFAVPTCVYQVSGEYSMLIAAARHGWIEEKAAVLESLLCIKRAGADVIFSYFAQKVAAWLKEQ